ncbi:hypothetical protein VPH35_091732 [Triticum aestivum]
MSSPGDQSRRIDMELDAPLFAHDRPPALCSSAGEEDRLGALPDDVLRFVIRRLDTRSALATAALSKRWALLLRELPALEFKVRNVLPERYRRYFRRRIRALNRRAYIELKKDDLVLGRYERRAMRSLADSLGGFLDADDGAEPGRHVHRVNLEIFPTHNRGTLASQRSLQAIRWGVEDLEIVVLNSDGRHRAPSYSFPHRYLDIHLPNYGAGVKLKRLKLTNCAPHVFRLDSNPSPAPAHAFNALTMLVLQDMPRSTRGRIYQSVIRACPALEVLHLRSCGCECDGRSFTIDAPGSRITELFLELTSHTLRMIYLRALPRLERLACMGAPLELKFGSVPRLARLSLTHDEDADAITSEFVLHGVRKMHPLSRFLSGLTSLEELVLRFTGPDMWILRSLGDMPPLSKLKRLLVADMPSSWDITWTRYILEAAPFLEIMHIHVDDDDSCTGVVTGKLIRWAPSPKFKRSRLGEVVVGGFEGTPRQVHFVRFLTSVCTALRDVVLLRNGHVRDKGLWDWETVAPRPEWKWSDEDRDGMLREIEDGGSGTSASSCSTTRIVFG